MKRHTKGYSGQEVALFPTMLNVSEPSTLPSRITSSPSHSPSHLPEPSPSQSPAPSIEHLLDHTTAAVSFLSLTQPTQPSPRAEQHIPTPHDSPLHAVYSHRSDEGSMKLNELTTLLILRVKKLEAKVKAETTRKRARVVLSEDDADVEDDSSKQGRKLSDAEVQEKKGNSEVSTIGATKGTASEVPVVSTAEENISTAGRTVTYRRRSEEKRTRKDKGKEIMTEPEPKKKSKKELEQERLSFAEAIRLQLLALDEERVTNDPETTKDIDWNDPSVQKYWDLKNKPKSEA
ncbi:hypothetical protein Tco_1558120 [Tanacetum coccineum]